MKTKIHHKKLPESFRELLWSYRFSEVDAEEDKMVIVVNTINYGDWEHWQWIFNYYGTSGTKKIIEEIPASAFRKSALKLVCLLLGIEKMKYATRSDQIKARKNI